jgi:hypothetical protein
VSWQSVATNAVLACGVFSISAQAQEMTPVASAPQRAAAAPAGDVAACDGCLTVPALTSVRIELLKTLSSATSNSGDLFPIRLAAPIMIDGKEAVPAGVTGLGEVVHAKKNGGAGAAGELVLAARYLEVGGKRLRLRSLRTEQSGESRIETAAIASATVLGVFGFLIKGGKLTIAEGTVAQAKTAEPFHIAPSQVQTATEGGAPIAATVPAKGNEQP